MRNPELVYESKSVGFTPTTNFPFYVERVWFGDRATRGTVTRWDHATGREVVAGTLDAYGVLATLPMTEGRGTFRVRYFDAVTRRQVKNVLVRVGVRNQKTAVDILSTD